jgi:hypothetical protein
LDLEKAYLGKSISLKLGFYGKRNEPDLCFKVNLADLMVTGENEFDMIFSPKTKRWEVVV